MLFVPEHEAGNREDPVPENDGLDELCIISQNSRGSSLDKLTFMSKLTSVETVGYKVVILTNQENFLLKSNTYKLLKVSPITTYSLVQRSKGTFTKEGLSMVCSWMFLRS